VTQVVREHTTTMAFRASNDRRIRIPKREIGVALDQSAYSRKIIFATVGAEGTVLHVSKKCIQRDNAEALLDHVRCFGHDFDRNDKGPAAFTERNHRGCVMRIPPV